MNAVCIIAADAEFRVFRATVGGAFNAKRLSVRLPLSVTNSVSRQGFGDELLSRIGTASAPDSQPK
jgi:hypothetical protein